MDLRQLAYFVGIARAGSFSKAAGVLHIAQPALSRQMALLEAEVGVLLLTRNGRGAIPTPAGNLLLPRAIEILRSVEEAKWQVSSLSATPSGVIRVGLPLSISDRLTPELIEGAKVLFPRISIQISESWTGHIYRDLMDGQLDFGVVGNSQLEGTLIHRPLVYEPMHLIKSANWPMKKNIHIADLAKIPLVLPPLPHAARLVVDRALKRFSVKPNIVLESEVWTIIKDVVQKGIACTLLPPREVYRELAAGSLVNIPILKPGIRSGLSLARRSVRALPSFADPVFEYMFKCLRNIVAGDVRHSNLTR